MKKRALIFGGSGFIGTHYTKYLLETGLYSKITIADIVKPDYRYEYKYFKKMADDGIIEYKFADVRNAVSESFMFENYDLIANFAAVHREPGHEHEEYFITNIRGAENVCSFAEKSGCRTIVFTSSIAVYNTTDIEKDEDTVPAPVSAYGSSKLAAEKIHLAWKRGGGGRHLLIVRPGVVYGPGEGGNVSRMIRAVGKGYFVFTGNKSTSKASVYVKELCRIIDYCLKEMEENRTGFLIVNAVYPSPPAVSDYTDAIKSAVGWKRIISDIPLPLILAVSIIVSSIYSIAGKKSAVNPARVRKLSMSNNIIPERLLSLGYKYSFTLEKSFSDWLDIYPDDWK